MPSGAPLHDSGMDLSSPSQVCRAGILRPSANARVVSSKPLEPVSAAMPATSLESPPPHAVAAISMRPARTAMCRVVMCGGINSYFPRWPGSPGPVFAGSSESGAYSGNRIRPAPGACLRKPEPKPPICPSGGLNFRASKIGRGYRHQHILLLNFRQSILWRKLVYPAEDRR